MTDNDYILLVLDGYFLHQNYLGEYIYRECKKAEQNFISGIEFFDRLANVAAFLQKQIDQQYYKELNNWYISKNISESQGEWNEELEKTKPEKNHFAIHLLSITKGKYTGHLYESDLEYISTKILASLKKYKAEVLPADNNNAIQKKEGNTSPLPQFQIKPNFKPEVIPTFYDILKDFFNAEHQTQLETMLKSGDNTSEPLLFKDNGNRLADAFKQLIESDFITGCQKKDLESWICNNFQFLNRKQVKPFTPDYIEKCISRNYYPCKRPLLKIENGKIVRNN